MLEPMFNAHVVIVEFTAQNGELVKAYAFQHEDGTFYQIGTFEPLSGDVKVLGHTDTVAAYDMENGVVTEFETFGLHENIVEPDDQWVV